MSLINQMLHDLDKRRTRGVSSPDYIIAGLHSPRTIINSIAEKQRFSLGNAILLGLLGILLGSAVWRLLTITANEDIPSAVSMNQATPKIVGEKLSTSDFSETETTGPLIENKQDKSVVEHARRIPATDLYSSQQSTPDTKDVLMLSTNEKVQLSKVENNITEPLIRADEDQDLVPARKLPVHEKPERILSRGVIGYPSQQQTSKPVIVKHIEEQKSNTLKKKFRPVTEEQLAEKAYLTGIGDIRKGNIGQGMEQLRIALSHYPKHIMAREILAGLLIKSGQNMEATTLLRKGIELHPGHSQYSKLYSRILLEEGDMQSALDVLEINKPSINADPQYYAILAAVYQKVDEFEKAAEIYRQLVTLQPNSAIFWMGLGISLEGYGRSEAAMDAYQYAIKSGGLQPGLVNFISSRISAIKNKVG